MPDDRLTACQARAARAMLNWTIRDLCENSTISESSIRRVESASGVPNVSLDLLVKLREFFESRGFVFTMSDRDGPGVRWVDYPWRKSARQG